MPSRPTGIPDMRYINRQIPVAKIAGALDLRFDGATKIHCWHPERHQHGDRTASVGIRASNNTVKCFGCYSLPMGPIDLVMDVKVWASPADAALWIAERFTVPLIPAQKRLASPPRSRWRAGHERGLDLIVRSGVWARLSTAAQAVAPVLLHLSEEQARNEDGVKVHISYRGIMRFAGLGSPNAVRSALVELRDWGVLRLPGDGTVSRGPERPTASYMITPNSDELWELCQTVARQMHEEIAAEKELRARLKKERIHLLRGKREPSPMY